MRILLSAFLSLFFALSAYADGSCRLVNMAGVANLEMKSRGGEISGINGVSKIESIERSGSAGAVETYTIRYHSKLSESLGGGQGGETVEVVLVVVPTPMTALMGADHTGAIYLPIGIPALMFPGPFGAMPGGWNNPFGPFVPTSIPAGYAPVAAAYCSLN